MNNTLLELLLNVTTGNVPPDQPVTPPRWAGPNPAIRQAQATLYATLCATLFAAFLATLGKQWLNRYSQTHTRGSIEDRCREREQKLGGIDRWQFHIVMQFATLTIQASLALLGSALSRYLWEVDRTVSSVVIGFTSVGCVLYIAIVALSVHSFDCPFQTPLSSLLRSTINAAKSQWQDRNKSAAPDQTGAEEAGLGPLTLLLGDHRRQVYRALLSPSWEGYEDDARCIARMFVISSNVDTIRLTMDFIQEVVWGAAIKSVPLEWIHGRLISCFDTTHPDTPILISRLKDIAYLSAKAFTRIRVQQRCIPECTASGNGDENPLGDAQCAQLHFLESSDPDLGSVLFMVRKEAGYKVDIPWERYKLSPDHHLWVSNLFVYDAIHNPLSKDVEKFVKYSLDPSNPPRDPVIAGCLCIINIILGNPFSLGYLARSDKRLDCLVLFSVLRLVLMLSKRPDAPHA